ncbi:MAG: efflux RND transporter permease subunit [Acidobacteriota bacterium]|nr:efflux RND transporter permease subunit [Acidobacteriota bacterium]
MSLARFALRNRVLVDMAVVLTLAVGIGAYATMTREILPNISLDVVTVATLYPSASPEEVERLITAPIEREIRDIEGIEEVLSTSVEGLSSITCRLRAGLDDGEIDRVVNDARTAIERLRNLPAGAEESVVQELRGDFQWPVIDVALYGAADERRLVDLARSLKDELGTIPGVSTILVSGRRDREFRVAADPDRLAALGVSLEELTAAVASRNVDAPGGVVTSPHGEILVRTLGTVTAAHELGDIIVKATPEGALLRVRDVARLEDGFADARTYARLNGQRALDLRVLKTAEGNTLEIVDAVQRVAASFADRLPAGVRTELFNDSSAWIRNRLRIMYSSGILGLTLVLVVLYLSLTGRLAVMTALGIPVAIAVALILMHLLGMTINLMTLFGLILVLGLLVDDAIVVVENVYRHLQAGLPPAEAALRGTEQVFWPVVATVVTTVAAFLPLLMMTGLLGKILGVLPIVMTCALVGSLVEALIVLPVHVAAFGQAPPVRARRRTASPMPRARRLYTRLLVWALRRRYRVVAAVLVTLVLVVTVLGRSDRFVLVDSPDLVIFAVKLEAPEGTPLEETERRLARLERELLAFPAAEVKTVLSTAGYYQVDQAPEYGSHVGMVAAELADFELRERPGDDILAEFRQRIAGLESLGRVSIQRVGGGPPQGADVELRIRGDRYGDLARVAERIAAALRDMPGVVDVRDDYEAGKRELRVLVDEEAALLRGVDVRRVARTVQTSIAGTVAAQLRTGQEEIDVVVRLEERFRDREEILAGLRVTSRGGEPVPLAEVARLERSMGPARIYHVDGQRAITVTAAVDPSGSAPDGSRVTPASVNEELFAAIEAMGIEDEFPGVTLSTGGINKETQESIASLLRAFGLAFLLIYVILGGLFRSWIQPLVVMFTIPFSVIGVLVGVAVMGAKISLLTLIGVVALAGIVVNDSLVLIDFVNRRRDEGMSLARAVVTAGRDRFRPVLLTTVTTVLALMPLAATAKGQAAFLAPMALAVCWGLTFATALTLVVIPSVYAISQDLRRLVAGRATRRARQPRLNGRLQVLVPRGLPGPAAARRYGCFRSAATARRAGGDPRGR